MFGSLALDSLRADFAGSILQPNDEGFAAVMTPHTPAVILRPVTVDDVTAAIKFASSEKLSLSVRSGGHSGGLWTTGPDGIVLDMSAFAAITVEGDLVTVGPGATWGLVAQTLSKHDLAITSGDTKSVGVGGLTLGGGIGWLVRKYGLAIDSLVSAELVTASGELITASADTNPDLFWAIRGGGGNFGVVTSFTFQGHPLDGVVHGAISYAPSSLAALLRGYRDVMRSAPEELNVTFAKFPPMGPDMPGGPQLHLVYAGSDEAIAMEAIAPLLELDGYVSHDIRSKAYFDVLDDPHPPEPGAPMPVFVGNSAFAPQLSDALADDLAAFDESIPSAILMLRYLQGAFNRVDAEATALAWRDSEAFVISMAFLPPTAGETETAAVDDAWSRIAPHTRGVYGNFLTYAGERAISAMYPAQTRAQLARVKHEYDPTNLFDQNQNVVPEAQR